jgi:hypothetical protein
MNEVREIAQMGMKRTHVEIQDDIAFLLFEDFCVAVWMLWSDETSRLGIDSEWYVVTSAVCSVNLKSLDS